MSGSISNERMSKVNAQFALAASEAYADETTLAAATEPGFGWVVWYVPPA